MSAETTAGRTLVPSISGGLLILGGALVGLIVLGLLIGPAALFLVACIAAGFGITYLSGTQLVLEERVAFGAVIGSMAMAIVTFGASSLAKDVTLATVTVGAAVALAAGVAAAIANRSTLRADWADANRRWWASPGTPGHPWPLAAIFLGCAVWTVHFLHQAYVIKPDNPSSPGAGGLYTGYVNLWGDWAAHLTFAGSFAYGHNFPPQYSIDPGNHLGYPFMVDFLAANLVPLGATLTASLVLTAGLLGLAFPAVFYLAAVRFAGGRAAAAIAVFVFLLSGGLGFVYLASDIDKRGFGALQHLSREYTLNRDFNYQWLNPVLAYLVPQRSTLFGFSLVLIALLLLWLAVRDGSGWRPFLFAGVLVGAMPVFQVHAYGTVVALATFWAVANRRRQWLYFFAPAVILAAPVLLWMWPPSNNSMCGDRLSIGGFCIQPGWLSYSDWKRDATTSGVFFAVPVDFVWFWIKNMSLFVPLLLIAHAIPRVIPTGFGRWFAPMWLWFAVPSVVILQPWEWDNTKFFVFWALLGSIMVGALIAATFKRGPEAVVLACVLMFLLGFAGALDLTRASDFSASSNQFIDTKGLQVADWVRHNTSGDAVFALADEHNNPVPTLTGRRVLLGYPGWLWTYGLADYTVKEADENAILRGDTATADLVKRYHISYVLIGPQELSRRASITYWRLHGTLVYTNGEYSVFKT